jgi:hypothetical protein
MAWTGLLGVAAVGRAGGCAGVTVAVVGWAGVRAGTGFCGPAAGGFAGACGCSVVCTGRSGFAGAGCAGVAVVVVGPAGRAVVDAGVCGPFGVATSRWRCVVTGRAGGIDWFVTGRCAAAGAGACRAVGCSVADGWPFWRTGWLLGWALDREAEAPGRSPPRVDRCDACGAASEWIGRAADAVGEGPHGPASSVVSCRMHPPGPAVAASAPCAPTAINTIAATDEPAATMAARRT